LAPEKERHVAAFDYRDIVLREEPVHRSFVDRGLLELVDGQAIVARSRGPVPLASEGAAHCAYTCTV
ncbi:MAG TPA: hypothetical protein VK499_06595, partial [Propionibacteriaceae bacterium]|nr:hypothetical protein [Propionibacteriaceae bacterium]